MNESVLSNFGFHKMPFTREVGSQEYFDSKQIQESLGYLADVLKNRRSGAIIAPPGLGKTCLLRKLRQSLPESRFDFHYVKCSKLGKVDMYRELCIALGLPTKGTAPSLRLRIEEYFLSLSSSKAMVPVLLLDDAHEIRPDILVLLRILTNFEMDSKLLLSIILCGQKALRQTLKMPALEDVAKRLSHVATLQSLSKEESINYIRHRCSLAGQTQPPFDEGALLSIIEQTHGNMRAMDELCCKTLEIATHQGSKVCDSNQVLQARGYLL